MASSTFRPVTVMSRRPVIKAGYMVHPVIFRKINRRVAFEDHPRIQASCMELKRGTGSRASALEADARERILESSLKCVTTHGWTTKAIVEGVKLNGYPSTAHALFPRGGAELALYFYRKSNKMLMDQIKCDILEQGSGNKVSSKDLLRRALQKRLRMTAQFATSWPQAMAAITHPNSATDALACLYELVDDLWHLAGDQSADTSWYSKRLSLAAIYKLTELFMLQDQSEDLRETWQFLDHRLEDIATAGAAAATCKGIADGIANGALSSAWTVLRNMIGANPR